MLVSIALTHSVSDIPSGRPTFRKVASRCGNCVHTLAGVNLSVYLLTLPMMKALHIADILVGPVGLMLCAKQVKAEMMSCA